MAQKTFIYDQAREAAQERYQKAVLRARFLKGRQRINWSVLGGSLTTKELKEAEAAIIEEDLRRLKMKHQLERIKPLAN